MPKVSSEIVQPYFSHDFSALQDKKIRKLIQTMGFEGYGIYWAIVEFMHRDTLEVGEENLVISENEAEKVKKILTDFDLFFVEDGVYFSHRILKNLNKQEEILTKKKEAATVKWLLSSYVRKYEKEFGIELSLSKEEVSKIKELAKEIPDFKNKLEDVFYTAHKMPPFDNGVRADSSWLLKKNNFREVLQGHYGPLKSKNKKKEIELPETNELQEEINLITTREDAMEFLTKKRIDTRFISPHIACLMDKFNITTADLKIKTKETS